MIPQLFNESLKLSSIIENLSNYSENLYIRLKINKIPVFNELYNTAIEKENYMINRLSEKAIEKMILYSDNLLSVAVVPVIMYYFLADGKTIYNKIMLIVPARKRNIVKKIIKDIDRALSRYVAGQFFLCIIIAVLSFILFFIFNVKFIIWLSIINGIFNIIPYFGPIFGAVPAVFIAFLDSPSKGIYVTIGLFILQQIEGNILSPKITGESIDIHPFVIIILLLIGDSFGGFIGMIFIIPCAVIIKVLYEDINYYLF